MGFTKLDTFEQTLTMTEAEHSAPQWVCLSINQNAIREGDLLQIIKDEMQKIFGPDLHDMVVMCDKLAKELFEMNVENYLFVKVSKYFDHVRELKDSMVVFGVLDSYDSPAFVEEAEVMKFRDSMKTKLNIESLQRGDVVQIKEGYLKNLKGVIVDNPKGEKYKVFFKFHTYSFMETMWRKNLIYLSSIFDIDNLKTRYSAFLRKPCKYENILRRKKLRKSKRKK